MDDTDIVVKCLQTLVVVRVHDVTGDVGVDRSSWLRTIVKTGDHSQNRNGCSVDAVGSGQSPGCTEQGRAAAVAPRAAESLLGQLVWELTHVSGRSADNERTESGLEESRMGR